MIIARRLSRLFAASALVILASSLQVQAQTVAVMVNGEAITSLDIDQRSRLNALSGTKASRQDIIEELINEKLKIKEGKKYSVDPGATEIDNSFANTAARMRLTPEGLTQTLAAKGIRANTFKARLKADMVWNAILRGRFKNSFQVSDREVDDAVRAAGGDTQAEAYEYHLRPVILIASRDSNSGALESRRREAASIRERVKSCDQVDGLVRTLRSATVRATVVKSSADLPPPLRDILDKTPVGSLTPPEVTRQGIEMVALCAKRPTKVDTPKKREIREKLFQQRYEARSKTYLEELRRAAMIERR